MNTFLQDVAHDLHTKLNGDFSKVAIVFPNKRAGLFFNENLAKEHDGPLWAPVYVSISDLMQQMSDLYLGDPILLTTKLYTTYQEITHSTESLDSFYAWGQLLISDFDDVDKNLVDADRIFENLQDLKDESGDLSFLDEEQRHALNDFFNHFFAGEESDLRKKFAQTWNNLHLIYHAFRKRIREMNIAYEGMLYRDVIENIDTGHLKFDQYVFVGFNVLNKVENRFFSILKEAHKAMFYWDYDQYYVPQAGKIKFEAGEFIKRNIDQFGNELPYSMFDHLQKEKQINFIASPSENAQARYVSEWAKNTLLGEEKQNAVVLCNEALLMPTIHSIPDNIKNVNVTMGFPLSQTPIFNLVNELLDLQTEGYNTNTGTMNFNDVRLILSHPYVQHISSSAEQLLTFLTKQNHPYLHPSELQKDDFLTTLFTFHQSSLDVCNYLMEVLTQVAHYYKVEDDMDSTNIFLQLYQESIYQCYTKVKRLKTLITGHDLTIEPQTLNRLLDHIMQTSSIPFHGEPAIGMQIMGVLETRNLDFNNLLLLSVNEGQLPKSGGELSFIPYNLRKAFGMTTIEHKNAVFAYYFYRLIQRAQVVTLMYNSVTSEMNKGEMSRFMMQLMVEYPFKINKYILEGKQMPTKIQEIVVQKSEAVMNQLKNRYIVSQGGNAHLLSPSALNHYKSCSLQFYFSNVIGLKAPDQVNIEINSPMFGTIFHKSAELAYKKIIQADGLVTSEAIDRFIKDPLLIDRIINSAFNTEFFNLPEDEIAHYNGTQLINYKVIKIFIRQMLLYDKKFTPFYIVALEKPLREVHEIDLASGKSQVILGGVADRIDKKDNTIRIVDYKTSGDPLKKTANNVEELFGENSKKTGYIFQTFLYSMIEHRLNPQYNIKPILLYIHKTSNISYEADVKLGKDIVENIGLYEEEYRTRIKQLIEDIFNPDIPFTQTKDNSNCKYCDFAKICNR